MQANCEVPEPTYFVTALWKTKAPQASSICFLLERRTGKSSRNDFLWVDLRVSVIAAYFRGNINKSKMF